MYSVLKKLLSNKHLQEAALDFTTSSWEKKAMPIIFNDDKHYSLNFRRHKQLI